MFATLANSVYVFVYIRAVMALCIWARWLSLHIQSVIGRACTIIFFKAEISYKSFNIAHQLQATSSLFADHVSLRQVRFRSCMIFVACRKSEGLEFCPSPPASQKRHLMPAGAIFRHGKNASDDFEEKKWYKMNSDAFFFFSIFTIPFERINPLQKARLNYLSVSLSNTQSKSHTLINLHRHCTYL